MKTLNFKSLSTMKQTILFSGLFAFLITATMLGGFMYFQKDMGKTIKIEHINATPSGNAVFTYNKNGEPVPLDFTAVSEKTMDAVVHIKATQTPVNVHNFQKRQPGNPFEDMFKNDPFEEFFGPRFFYRGQPREWQGQPRPGIGQGSGVMISDDGFIVTNNHVVANADDLEVTLHDNRIFKATVIGTDPTTDLALLQIKGSGFTSLPFVNSDKVKVGEWVMAIGNPFNLTSTVTAGIVSAKGRNINILKEQFAVESFIQTDAAINPGNSGGALVNLQGGLIGINTAIASPTGAYSGYGFAVPANIVSKVVEDLMKYGVVQRGVLGVSIRSVDGNLMNDKDLDINTGVYVDSLLENSAAAAAGIKTGDVIVGIGDTKVGTASELQELIARHRPGDEVLVKINRKGKEKAIKVTLNNRKGNTNLVDKEHKEILSILGADLETLDEETAKKLDLKGGVKVKELYSGKFRRSTNMQEGFIITKVDGQLVKSLDEFIKILEDKKGGVMLEGLYENLPGDYYYAFGM